MPTREPGPPPRSSPERLRLGAPVLDQAHGRAASAAVPVESLSRASYSIPARDSILLVGCLIFATSLHRRPAPPSPGAFRRPIMSIHWARLASSSILRRKQPEVGDDVIP